MTKRTDLLKLHAIADMALQTELAKLAAIASEEKEPRQALETLSTEQARLFEQSRDTLGLTRPNAMENWIGWAQKERQKISETLLEIQTRKEHQIARSRRAFGKRTALEKIMNKSDPRR